MKSLKRVEGINVVPLIDVMLVLLAIILTISSFIALGKLEITLPNAVSQEKLEPKRFDIVINSKKEFFVNEKPISKENLYKEVETIKKEDVVAISADKLAPYEKIILESIMK